MKDFIKLLSDNGWLRPQTFYTTIFYISYCVFIFWKPEAIPECLDEVVRMLLVFWFGSQVGKTVAKNGGETK